MCKRCGRINSKNKAAKHKKSHNADGARASRDRGRVDLETFTPEAPRMFWSELLMPGRCIDDMWSGRAEDLRDPTEMFELIYDLFCRQTRVPQPFAHFGVLPIWRVWNDTKGYPELLYEPSKEDRDRLWLRHMAQAVKESNSTSFGAPYATRVQFTDQAVQTYHDYETQKSMRKKVQHARDMMHQEVDQVRERMAAMEKQHKAELRQGRERRNKLVEQIRA